MGSSAEKVRTVLALIIVIGLVFTTNRLDKRHFEQVQENITSIHEDRVLAQDYLFDLSNIFHERRLRMTQGELVSFENDNEIEVILDKYRATYLTSKEKELFQRLTTNLNQLEQLGAATYGSAEGNTPHAILKRIDKILAELSDIQVRESKSLKLRAQKSLESNLLVSNLEIILVVVIGIILQFALFHGGKKRKTKWSTKG